eukprot:766393-Hanusia_phi.AAC.17
MERLEFLEHSYPMDTGGDGVQYIVKEKGDCSSYAVQDGDIVFISHAGYLDTTRQQFDGNGDAFLKVHVGQGLFALRRCSIRLIAASRCCDPRHGDWHERTMRGRNEVWDGSAM